MLHNGSFRFCVAPPRQPAAPSRPARPGLPGPGAPGDTYPLQPLLSDVPVVRVLLVLLLHGPVDGHEEPVVRQAVLVHDLRPRATGHGAAPASAPPPAHPAAPRLAAAVLRPPAARRRGGPPGRGHTVGRAPSPGPGRRGSCARPGSSSTGGRRAGQHCRRHPPGGAAPGPPSGATGAARRPPRPPRPPSSRPSRAPPPPARSCSPAPASGPPPPREASPCLRGSPDGLSLANWRVPLQGAEIGGGESQVPKARAVERPSPDTPPHAVPFQTSDTEPNRSARRRRRRRGFPPLPAARRTRRSRWPRWSRPRHEPWVVPGGDGPGAAGGGPGWRRRRCCRCWRRRCWRRPAGPGERRG